MKFKNKVCVLTGGAAGIGRCLAERFSAEGARVYIIDKNRSHHKTIISITIKATLPNRL